MNPIIIKSIAFDNTNELLSAFFEEFERNTLVPRYLWKGIISEDLMNTYCVQLAYLWFSILYATESYSMKFGKALITLQGVIMAKSVFDKDYCEKIVQVANRVGLKYKQVYQNRNNEGSNKIDLYNVNEEEKQLPIELQSELRAIQILTNYKDHKINTVHIVVQPMKFNDDYALQMELHNVAYDCRDILTVLKTTLPYDINDLYPPYIAYAIIELEELPQNSYRTCIFLEKKSSGINVTVKEIPSSVRFPVDIIKQDDSNWNHENFKNESTILQSFNVINLPVLKIIDLISQHKDPARSKKNYQSWR